jgi:hypothetical protein
MGFTWLNLRPSAMQLRMQLATLKKQDFTATGYFNRVENLADNLVAVEVPLCDDEVVAYVLTSLSEEYDSLVSFVMTRAKPMSLSEVYTNLLSFEVHPINRNGSSSHGHTLAANYVSRGSRDGRHNGHTSGRSGGPTGSRSGGRSNNNHIHYVRKTQPRHTHTMNGDTQIVHLHYHISYYRVI